MTFEDPLLEKAQKDIENTEKLCSESTKMFSSFKKAFGISSSSSSSSLKVYCLLDTLYLFGLF